MLQYLIREVFMVNLEHKLTVDDLIVEYMMYKVKNGYEPSFTKENS